MKKHPWLRPAVSLMLLLHLAGCYSWQPVTVSPRQFVEDEQPGHIRISQGDDEELELRNPRIEGDSLAARISTYNRTGIVRIALTDITAFRARRFSTLKTWGAVVLTSASLAVSLVWLSLDRR